MNTKYRERWLEYVKKEQNSFAGLVQQDPIVDWSKSTIPDIMASLRLQYATENMFAGDPFGFARIFLDQAIDVCDSFITGQRWLSSLCKGSFPRNRGEAFRVKAYATGLREGGLKSEWLTQSSNDYYGHTEGMGWRSPVVHGWYLTAILSAVIVNDLVRARMLLKRKKRFYYYVTLHELLVEILDSDNSFPLPRSGDLFARFQSYFDEVRDPSCRFQESSDFWMKRIELGLLGYRVFEVGDGHINWSRIVEAIAE